GDWNDGLSAAGKNWKGESVWLAEFLYGILKEFVEILEHFKVKFVPNSLKEKYKKVSVKLKENINKYCWDGEWFWCATKDNGDLIGSRKNKEGMIFLNTQTWAIMNGITDDKDRQKKILNSLEKYLYHKYGPVLLYPAYSKPDKEIGYLTEYSPGVRENGGLYVHAGCWALLMECLLQRKDKVEYIYKNLNPIFRSTANPDLYKTEPYVTCGDIYGPNSSYFGQGGWSWYTGSAQWLFKVTLEYVFGIRPCLNGILVSPCLPEFIKKAKVELIIKNTKYRFLIINKKVNQPKLTVDGEQISGNLVPFLSKHKLHQIVVTV
ncbi:MAG: glycosyl transferase family 36, partial [Endomicrobia bacterium]|nr:glycosyl transferase family 36 [Endomicrobiia bacterium]